ncbi:transposase [Segetibacter sp. 3557_3]|uniref:transposase n=1 Tax=Segetibacter sp. 3557_3 TaxID=2547429 RepID=UPI00105845FE|nr:transposase [Segetibacter sp. 3557_3]TDH26760.1 transposase [Segetibacter sp. 3557_3]
MTPVSGGITAIKWGKPSKPIRLLVSLLTLKYLQNLSDGNLVEQWAENIYFQYFSGEQHFQPNISWVPTELIAFRQRIGEPGVELTYYIIGAYWDFICSNLNPTS